MRILVVSSYPPRHCGIGAYASGQVARLRAESHEVTVLSPPDGNGDERIEFLDGRAFRRAAELAPGFDRVIIHFEPGIYIRRRAPWSKLRTSWSLLRLVDRVPQLEVVVHETYPAPIAWRPDHRMLRRALAGAHLQGHTEAERLSLQRAYRPRHAVGGIAPTPGVELLDRYVPDEEFDAWIAAADAVVLPYRRAWSSGVLARAQTIGTPAIVSDVGGLADQAGPGDRIFHDDGELREVFEATPAG